MFKKLVRYEGWHYLEVDPICLKRKALDLRAQIFRKVPKDNDPYFFYSRTMPIIEAAIRGEIVRSLDQRSSEFISENYYHDASEGILTQEYDSEFDTAVAEFSVAAEAYSLEHTEKVLIDGVTYKWLDLEEEDDWPDNVKHP